MTTAQQSHRFPWGVVIASAIALVILLALGTAGGTSAMEGSADRIDRTARS